MNNTIINKTIWNDIFIENLSSEGKLLYFYCITNVVDDSIKHLSINRISFDTKIDESKIEDILDKFTKVGIIEGYTCGY